MSSSLAMAIGLRPLDRVMIRSKEVLRECCVPSGGIHMELPFWYFQFVTPQGDLRLRSPIGSTVDASPLDVCDIIKGECIKVMAMPASMERRGRSDASRYAPATILYAHKDRWGLCTYFVQFDDPGLNAQGEGTTRSAPLCEEDQRRLHKRTRRTLMPVTSWPRGHSLSANHGVERAAASAQRDARAFISAALQGRKADAAALSCRDATPREQLK